MTETLEDMVSAPNPGEETEIPAQEPTEEPVEQEAEEPAAEEPEEGATEDPGEGAADGDEPPDEPPGEDEAWKKFAWLDERKKRQELEKRLAELEGAKKPEPEDPVSVLEDEDEAFKQRIGALERKLAERDLERSKRYAIEAHGEELVNQAVDWFNGVAPAAPALQKRFWDSLNDVGEVVKMFKENQKFERLSKADEYEAELEAKLRKKWEAELKQKQEQKARSESEKSASATPSLAAQPSEKGADSASGNFEDDFLGS